MRGWMGGDGGGRGKGVAFAACFPSDAFGTPNACLNLQRPAGSRYGYLQSWDIESQAANAVVRSGSIAGRVDAVPCLALSQNRQASRNPSGKEDCRVDSGWHTQCLGCAGTSCRVITSWPWLLSETRSCAVKSRWDTVSGLHSLFSFPPNKLTASGLRTPHSTYHRPKYTGTPPWTTSRGKQLPWGSGIGSLRTWSVDIPTPE